MAFFDACHINMWDVIDNGNYIPTNKNEQKVLREMNNRRQRLETFSQYEKVHSCKSSKKMWDTLALAYEGTSQVRDFKISMLVHKYEFFKMEDNKTIDLMFGIFQIITIILDH
ncbi:hypothetical protein CR513_21637, partial [Mucuna pruriens]